MCDLQSVPSPPQSLHSPILFLLDMTLSLPRENAVSSTKGIRAGRAFVELFADDSKLVRGLRRAEKKLKAFGQSVRNLGLKMATLGAGILAPLVGAAKAFSSMGDEVAKMSKRTGEVITLDDLIAEAGRDTSRFFFLMTFTNPSLPSRLNCL